MEAIRILSLGDLNNSLGGIYNAGCLADGSKRILLPRVEKDYVFTNDVDAVLIEGEIDEIKKGQYKHTILKRVGFLKDSRIEDFRLFRYKGGLYTTCTWVWGWNGMANSQPKMICPIICKIEDGNIILFDHLDIPIKRKQTEKNWQVFTFNDELYCLYSLDPFIIFKHQGFSWRILKEEENGLKEMLENRLPGAGHLSLSAMTQWDDKSMLGFWHTYKSGVIYQGAFLIDMNTLDITHFTEPILDGGDFKDGYKKNICYVSGLVLTESNIEVWMGECDSHTSLIEIPKYELNSILEKSTYIKKTPLKIGFNDNGLGDFICMSYALQGWLDKNPERKVKLYLRNHYELFSCINLPRVTIHSWSDEKVMLDLTSNEEPEYTSKWKFGDYKKWYAMKLNSEPTVPNMAHIIEDSSYKDCIVLAPFAVWDNRTWDIKYWILLSEMLMQRGERVIVIDPFENRVSKIHGEKHTGRSIRDNFSVIKASKLVIANDSGLAHAAGLLGTKFLVLSGWLDPKFVFSNTNVEYIYETTYDVNNQRNHNKNLLTITVDRVIKKLDEIL